MTPRDYIDWDGIRAQGSAEALRILAALADLRDNVFAAERLRIVGETVEAEAAVRKAGAQRRAALALDMKPARLGQLYHQYKEQTMITTSYGNFHTRCADATSTATLHEYVGQALGDFGGDYDVDAIAADFRAAINAQLEGTGVTLNGDEFYGPHPKQDVDIAGAIEEVDFWAIAADHDISA